jgi:hypothetical protein
MAALALERADRGARSLSRALASTDDPVRGRHLPVDWWDAPCGVWRPTALVAVGAAGRAPQSAEVLRPAGDATGIQAVDLGRLRACRLLTPGVASYWVLRHRLLLMLALVEEEPSGSAGAATILAAIHELRPRLMLAHDVWRAAHRRGSPPGAVAEGAISPDVAEAADLAWLPAGAARRAERLLAHDLLRLEALLRDAGEPAATITCHPLIAGLAQALLAVSRCGAQLSATLPRSAPASGASSGSRAASGRTLSQSASPSTSNPAPTSAASTAHTDGSAAPTPANSGMAPSRRNGPASSRIRRVQAGAATRWMGLPSARPRR